MNRSEIARAAHTPGPRYVLGWTRSKHPVAVITQDSGYPLVVHARHSNPENVEALVAQANESASLALRVSALETALADVLAKSAIAASHIAVTDALAFDEEANAAFVDLNRATDAARSALGKAGR